jgi:hypothetical protein
VNARRLVGHEREDRSAAVRHEVFADPREEAARDGTCVLCAVELSWIVRHERPSIRDLSSFDVDHPEMAA